MKEGNIILEKSFAFAVRIVELHKHLVTEHREYELSKQVLRSGTSIGSNAEEAVGGASKKDFINKFGISYKEARETKYWLRILKATNYIDGKMADSLINECEKLIRIITAFLNTTKGNNQDD